MTGDFGQSQVFSERVPVPVAVLQMQMCVKRFRDAENRLLTSFSCDIHVCCNGRLGCVGSFNMKAGADWLC